MKATTKTRVLRYGVPVDLVILATGVGLLLPGLSTAAVLAVYLAAVAASAWKGGWRGGVTAMLLAIVVFLLLFRTAATMTQLAAFAGIGALLCGFATMRDATKRQTATEPPAIAGAGPLSLAEVITFQSPPGASALAPADDRELRERFESEIAELQRRIDGQRRVFERDTLDLQTKFAAERATLERVAADREARARADVESVANERLEHVREELQRQLDEQRAAFHHERADLRKKLDEEREVFAQDRAVHAERLRADERMALEQRAVEREQRAREDAEVAARMRFEEQVRAAERERMMMRQQIDELRQTIAQMTTSADELAKTAAVAAEPERASESTATDFAIGSDRYDVVCYNCRVAFDATEADWCSCLTKERTLVCTNCLTCFCKAPPSYMETFWLDAPPRLFDRKAAELGRPAIAVGANPSLGDIKRPLVMLAEDDEDIQATVQRVCSNLGYGFIAAAKAEEGLDFARTYRPNLILADAFLPKVDGREMCRILKEEPAGAETTMIVMTGMYTDTKYKSEARERFHVDDYLSKPVSITDLINLLQRHLEGVRDLPLQENLYELHRQNLKGPSSEMRPGGGSYEVSCFTCAATFDAVKAKWCSGTGHDNTLLCPRCGNCFCKAPPLYADRFWSDAPSTLFERKLIGTKRSVARDANLSLADVKRPLVLLVEEDENIRLIVKTVVTAMGYGYIASPNGVDGQVLATEYDPDLILADMFTTKHLLKEDTATSHVKTIIMTGLHPRKGAMSSLGADDSVGKPLAVADLVEVLKRHLSQ